MASVLRYIYSLYFWCLANRGWVQKSVIHGRDMNYYGGGRGSDSARSRSGSPPIQEADPPVSLVKPPPSGCFINTIAQPTCQIQGATVHDVDHVDVDHNRSNRENPSSVHSDPAGSPDREIIPSVGSVERYPGCFTNVVQSSCYESDDALGFDDLFLSLDKH